MRKKSVHFKRDVCIIAVTAFVAAMTSHAFNVWSYLYDDGKFIDVQGTAQILIFVQYGPPSMQIIAVPPDWIHMSWTPLYLVAKEVRSESNHYLAPYGDVSTLITMLSSIAFITSFSISALRSILTFNYLFDNRWSFRPSLNFRDIIPL